MNEAPTGSQEKKDFEPGRIGRLLNSIAVAAMRRLYGQHGVEHDVLQAREYRYGKDVFVVTDINSPDGHPRSIDRADYMPVDAGDCSVFDAPRDRASDTRAITTWTSVAGEAPDGGEVTQVWPTTIIDVPAAGAMRRIWAPEDQLPYSRALDVVRDDGIGERILLPSGTRIVTVRPAVESDSGTDRGPVDAPDQLHDYLELVKKYRDISARHQAN